VSGVEPTENAVLFPSSGQFVMRSGFGPPEEFEAQTHIIFDVGQYRTNHSHYDALMMHLHAGGLTVLPDSGLYSYEEGADHDYFYGTSAHNTVVVDGLDQAEGTAHPGETIQQDGWIYQSGFHNLYDGVVHRRAVLMLDRELVLVVDELDSADPHTYTQTWHLFPTASEVQGDATMVTVVDEDGSDMMRIHQSSHDLPEFEILYGQEDPVQGWYSDAYEEKVANYAIEYTLDEAHSHFATLFATGAWSQEEAHVELDENGTTVTVQLALDSVQYAVTIQDMAGSQEQVTVAIQ